MWRIVWTFVGCVMISTLQAKPIEILLWHSLAGNLGSALHSITNEFNQSQTTYTIKAVYKGDYIESLTSFAAAFRAHQPPALVQVFEVGTASMLLPAGIIKPVDALMQEAGLTLPTTSIFPAVRKTYSKDGQLMAMPFNTSVPILFYNADALAKVGYAKQLFPRTWDELERLAAKLKHAGFSCVYTTAYPAWILIESFSATQGLTLIDQNTHKALFNNQTLVHHLERILRWQRLHYFEYGGRADDATSLFTSGRCPLFSQSSGAYNGLAEWVPFKVGMAALPLEGRITDRRFNNVAGGAALWAAAGQSDLVYRGIARFFTYLADPLIQQHWHEATGYLPLGTVGVYKAMANKSHHPALQLAQQEFMDNTDTAPLLQQLGPLNKIRAINDEALETIFAGIKAPQQAMDDAVIQANHAIGRFLHNTSPPN